MIKAELSYNPYILETTAKFNSKEPHINSFVEKYRNVRIQDWIDDVPRLLYEELNGYDFELDFHGTVMEYSELLGSFKKANVSEEEVTINHSKLLGDRKEKLDQIDNLFHWLRDTENDYFDFDKFCNTNSELIDVHYPVFIVNGAETTIDTLRKFKISAEYIKSLDELDNTDVKFSPFIFYTSGIDNSILKNQLDKIRSFDSIDDSQLFFVLDEKNKGVERFLIDLGIENPLIIEDIDDDKVYDYLKAYPITQHIYDMCRMLKEKTIELDKQLSALKAEKEIENSSKYAKIQNLEYEIERISYAKEQLDKTELFIKPRIWDDTERAILDKLSKFKERYTKVTGSTDGKRYAHRYHIEANEMLDAYANIVVDSGQKEINRIKAEFSDIYFNSGINKQIELKAKPVENIEYFQRAIEEALLKCKIERIIEEKNIFAKKDDPPKKTKIIEYPMVEWRRIVQESIQEEMDSIKNKYFKKAQNYSESILKEYIAVLSKEEKELIKEKDKEISGLSEEEKRLEKDINWLKEFQLKIEEIERV